MFEGIISFFKKFAKADDENTRSKETAKERLHLVLMQDRANVSVDFLEMMKQEIIEVIKKYIDIDEKEIDVKLTNKTNEDGSIGAPALYANIPIANIKNENKNKQLDKAQVLDKQENSNNQEKENKDEIQEGKILENNSKNESNSSSEIQDKEDKKKIEETKKDDNKQETSNEVISNKNNEKTDKNKDKDKNSKLENLSTSKKKKK